MKLFIKVFLVVFFTFLVLMGVFCLWVLAKASSIATDKEEQMELERKLRK